MCICRKNGYSMKNLNYPESKVSVKNITILKACKAADFE